MDEAEGSSPSSSTLREQLNTHRGAALAGLAAGEGWFTATPIGRRRDGTQRIRFRFGLTMAERDAPLVTGMRDALGAGSIARQDPQRAGWQPTVTFSVSGRRSLREHVVPFFDAHLLAGHKRTQYLAWRRAFLEYESNFPSNWGAGPSPCAKPGCNRPVRGRGLCRVHYYEETGY